MTAEDNSAVERIAAMLASETGLCFARRRDDIEAGIRRAMSRAQVTDPQRFARLIETGQLALDDLIVELTVGETYFFRDPHQFDFIRHVVVPDVLARRGTAHTLRIWSAGCASGEEAYSLAITLVDAGLRGHVLATDLSRTALQRARAALYRRWSLRGLDASLVRRCFRQSGELWELDPRFRNPVTFAFHNLARSPYPSVPAGIWDMDLILCRNVLIYLDADATRRVVAGFAETLAADAWLVTGPSDPPLQGLAPLSPVATPHGVVYRRRAPDCSATPPSRSQSDVTLPTAAAVEPPSWKLSAEAPAFGVDQSSVAIRIRDIANRDGSASASEELDRLVERFPLSAELHLLRAIVRIDLNRHDEAIQSLRRVLYLDGSLVIAHFLLAATLRRQGRLEGARRAYRNAYDLARACPVDEPIPLGDGERAGTVAEVASAELALLDPRRLEAS